QGPFLRRTSKVGSYRPNAWGLYDMHGNVCEFCSDAYSRAYDESSPVVDPQGPADSSNPSVYFPHVIRGGARHNFARQCRSASRDPELGPNTLVGFRVAAD